jgi:UDP-N-acetylmuramyl tripeptide synthase
MAAAILGGRHALAWNSSGANLASGVASTLLAAPGAELALLEVDEAAVPELARRLRPRAVALANLFRDQLDRYGELEAVAARWRDAVASLGDATTLVVNADDPLVANLAAGRGNALRFGLDDPAVARPALQHAADSKHCVRCGAPYTYAATYVGHLGDYRCETCRHARPPLDVSAGAIELDGVRSAAFELRTREGTARVRLLLPGLYNVYNALAAASLSLALGAGLDDIVAGLEGFRGAFGRFERIEADGREVVVLLIKNPAGANEAIRTLLEGEPPPVVVLALNDAIADGRDVSWIWDVDFEPLLERVSRVVASGERAEEMALRCVYGGFPAAALEVVGDLGAALDHGLALVPPGAPLVVLPTYTAMLRLRAVAASRGLVRPYWERA